MNKTTALLIIIILVIITFPVFFITIPVLIYKYNAIVRHSKKVDQGFSGIEVMLKKRYDLIPNLVNAIKKLMDHEKSLIENITNIRTRLLENPKDQGEKFLLENQLSNAMGQLFVSMENYPQIKSDKNMLQLQQSLNECEEHISAARRIYNSVTTSYNTYIEVIPNNIVASASGFSEKPLFEVKEQERENVDVKTLFE